MLVVIVAVVDLVDNGGTSMVGYVDILHFLRKIWIKESLSYIKITDWLIRKFFYNLRIS